MGKKGAGREFKGVVRVKRTGRRQCRLGCFLLCVYCEEDAVESGRGGGVWGRGRGGGPTLLEV